MSKEEAIRTVAQFSMRSFEQASIEERIRLLKALSLVLPGQEAELAGAMAFNMERLDANQLKFRELLKGGRP